jgi:hypothetical protein
MAWSRPARGEDSADGGAGTEAVESARLSVAGCYQIAELSAHPMVAGPHLLRADAEKLRGFLDRFALNLPQMENLEAGVGNLPAQSRERIANGLDFLLPFADFGWIRIARCEIGAGFSAHRLGLLARGFAENVIGLAANDCVEPGIELAATRFELECGQSTKQL